MTVGGSGEGAGSGDGEMVGFGVDIEVDPRGLCDGLNVRSEGRERSGCWILGMNGEDGWRREMQGFPLEPVAFVMTDLVFCGDCAHHLEAALPSLVLRYLQCRAPRPSVMSQ